VQNIATVHSCRTFKKGVNISTKKYYFVRSVFKDT
jgi:hypothetical protein